MTSEPVYPATYWQNSVLTEEKVRSQMALSVGVYGLAGCTDTPSVRHADRNVSETKTLP